MYHTYKTKSNIGAGKLFYRNTSFSQSFHLKIKQYFGHKLIKNQSKNDISTIFWKLLSGSIRRTHPLFTIYQKIQENSFLSKIGSKNQKNNTKIWKNSPLRGICDRTDLKKWRKISFFQKSVFKMWRTSQINRFKTSQGWDGNLGRGMLSPETSLTSR